MIERLLTIANPLGLHARPAAQFVRLAASFDAQVVLERDGMAVNGKSIMGVMMLAAECGAELTLRVEGSDADAAAAALEQLVRDGFGE